jgi:nitrogen regulatory protein PII
MKFIVAVVKPSKLDNVREALTEIGIEGMTASEVKGYGRQKGHKEIYRGSEYTINFVPKIKIEVAVSDELAERAMQAIRESAATGQIGDGKIFVLPLEEAVRIRTGESGNNAL